MNRILVGLVVGFIVWSVLWLGTDELLKFVPTFYPTTDIDGSLNVVPTNFLLIKLLLSIIFSLLAGLIAASISRETMKAPLILGFMLLVVGIFFQFGARNILPLWYHLTFIILLLPMTLLGARLRKFEEVVVE